MNQEKIGKFIAELRKKSNLTQQELADKLGITDRAVSHWENGRSMPDVSLFQKLCEILNISVNELIIGEKISKDKLITKSDENIINTLNDNKRVKNKSKKIIIILIIGIIVLFIILILNSNNEYPHIDLYNFDVKVSDSEKSSKLIKKLSIDSRNIYYYGIDNALFCNKEEFCYNLKDALIHNQIFLAEFKQYLEKQVNYNNYQVMRFYDGGTSVFKKSGFLVMYCNTLAGNKDIYIGNTEMLDGLKGEYCGHDKNPDESFIRTYKIISSKISNKDIEFNEVTLKQSDGTNGTVLISNSFILIPGHTYEFSFLTFEKFDDTIENVFKHSTILKAIETDKDLTKQINEKIIVNREDINNVELNELEHVKMYIIDETLTKTSAKVRILDFSGHKYSYGADYYIERKQNGEWEKVELKEAHYVTAMAYGPDINGILEFKFNWKRYYGELDPGKYRIVKEALIESEPCTEKLCRKYLISAEFDIY